MEEELNLFKKKLENEENEEKENKEKENNKYFVCLKKNNEKIIIKEKSNVYCYKGKLINFNFLQKINKSISNKKFNLNFKDYKKLI
jgi:hypothetical protein